MTGHELARQLLALPDQTVFVQSKDNQSLWSINDVHMCTCDCEIIITQADY